MTAIEQARDRLVQARRALLRLRGDLNGADESRRAEVVAAMRAAHADAQEAESDVRMFEAADALGESDLARIDADRARAPSALRDLTPPTPDEIAYRGEIQYRIARGEDVSERERDFAAFTPAVERLFPRVLRLRAHGRLHELGAENLRAWRAYRENRAIAGGLDGTAADGAEWVPTNLENRIWAWSRLEGPMADDTRMTVARVDYFGAVRVSALNSVLSVSDVAQAKDLAGAIANSGMYTLNPVKWVVAVPVSAEIFEGRLAVNDMLVRAAATAMGNRLNDQRTTGSDGTLEAAWKTTDPQHTDTEDNGELAADDLVGLLTQGAHPAPFWAHRPNASVQMHGDTLMNLIGGDGKDVAHGRAGTFALTDSGDVVIGGGYTIERNPSLIAIGTASAGNIVVAGADLAQYIVAYMMGMRASVEYLAESDQYMVSFFQWHNAARRSPNGFAHIQNAAP